MLSCVYSHGDIKRNTTIKKYNLFLCSLSHSLYHALFHEILLITNQLQGAETFLEKLIVAQLIKGIQTFIKSDGSLSDNGLRFQVLTTASLLDRCSTQSGRNLPTFQTYLLFPPSSSRRQPSSTNCSLYRCPPTTRILLSTALM